MRVCWPAAVPLLLLTLARADSLSAPQLRLTPADIEALGAHEAGPGTSGISGIRTTLVAGDPAKSGPYTIRLSVPPNTRIQAHTHRDNRSAVVVQGTWYFGYGAVATSEAEKALPRGSFYTEPAGVAHFAETKSEAVIVYITGDGPTDTHYVQGARAAR